MFCGDGAFYVTLRPMTHTLIGYARCSTDKQDLAAQHEALMKLGVAADRIYTDKGFTGTNRNRPGLDQALAAVRSGDTLVVPKLDRLARSVPDELGQRARRLAGRRRLCPRPVAGPCAGVRSASVAGGADERHHRRVRPHDAGCQAQR